MHPRIYLKTVVFSMACLLACNKDAPPENPGDSGSGDTGKNTGLPRTDFTFSSQPPIVRGLGKARVLFHNTTVSSGATTFHWDFGNGQYSTNADSVVLILPPGRYNAKLVATNAAGSDSIIKQVNIIKYIPPV